MDKYVSLVDVITCAWLGMWRNVLSLELIPANSKEDLFLIHFGVVARKGV